MAVDIRDYTEERLIGMPMPRWSSRVSRCRACGRLGVEATRGITGGLPLTIHRELLSEDWPYQVVEACSWDSAGTATRGSFILS